MVNHSRSWRLKHHAQLIASTDCAPRIATSDGIVQDLCKRNRVNCDLTAIRGRLGNQCQVVVSDD